MLTSPLARLIVAVVALTLLTGASLGKYAGADAGYAVLSIAAKKDVVNFSYALFYRTRDGKEEGEFEWRQNVWRLDEGELNDPEKTGIVVVQALAPGDYEIYQYFPVASGGHINIPKKPPLSIPFTVRPGEAVYLGEYMAVDVENTDVFGFKFRAAMYVHLSDQEARDIAIAKTKQPAITTVTNAVPDPNTLGVGYMRNTPPPPLERPSWW